MITKKQTGQWARFCLRLLLPCLLAGGGLAGCTEEVPVSNQEPGQPVLMSISNRALNAGADFEQINTLRILLVNRNNIDRTVVCNRFVSSPADPLVIKVVSGTYDVYVVANETHDNAEFAALQSVRNLAALRQIAVPYSPADRDKTNIPMFGEVANVSIIAPAGEPSTTNLAQVSIDGGTAVSSLPVSLTRMACKVKLTLKRIGGTLTAVEFNNLPDAIPLFDDTYITPSARTTKTVEVGSFSSVTPTPPEPLYSTVVEQADILLPSWVFEEKTNIGNAMQLKVTTTEDTAERTYASAIGHAAGSSDTPKDYTLRRNYDYSLTAIITNNTVSVGASVTSWTDENLILEGRDPVIPTP